MESCTVMHWLKGTQSEPKMEKPSAGTTLGYIFNRAVIIALACAAGALHYWHVSSMFENDRNFSQITPLEREMSLRTEMGFYYSFYKTVVEERHLLNGIAKLAYDRLVEYPDEVNAINRFNIYPEMLAGALYHYTAAWLQRWQGALVEPIFFYLEAVWLCAGATLSVLFISATALCGNVAGGALAVAQYMMNHAECTRVQWAPNQRENFAQPFLLAQMALVTLQLRRPTSRANTIGLQTAILLLNCACLLFWQFSQYVLLTQVAIVFVMEQLCVVSTRRLCLFLHAHFCGLHMAVMLTQGNDMLLTSLYASLFAVVSVYSLALSSLRVKCIETRTDLSIEAWLVILRICIVASASLWLKSVISDALDVEDDSHIIDIFYSKFTGYRTFHTMLYTCSAVFSFLPVGYFWSVTKTGLLPSVGIAVSNVLYYWLFVGRGERNPDAKRRKEKTRAAKPDEASAEDSGIENSASDVRVRKRSARRRRKSSPRPQKEEDEKADKDIKSDAEVKTERSKDERCAAKAKSTQNVELDKMVARATEQRVDADKAIAKADERSDAESKERKRRKRCDKWVQYLRGLDVDAGILYNVSQMLVFGCMALIVMRLKLLFTPHLCLVASLAAKPAYYSRFVKRHKMASLCAAAALAGVAAYHGYNNFMLERSIIGEFYDPPLEELLRWVSRETGRGAVFAGPVPLAAAVLLTARRPVVHHPHYEHRTVRERTYSVYKTYGRFSPAELYSEMTRLRVTHLLLETQYCYGRSGLGCTFEEIWDHEVPSLRGRPLLCHRLLTEDVPHFYKVFQNERYAVFRVHDYSVRYTPRLYDT